VEGEKCAREAVTDALKSGSEDVISTAVKAYAARPCDNSAACAKTSDWLASTLDAGGKRALAVTFYVKAAETDASAARWLKAGDRALRAQLYGVARNALERADHSPDATPGTRAYSAGLMQHATGYR
jgi:cobalamin biosynthesis protein CobT